MKAVWALVLLCVAPASAQEPAFRYAGMPVQGGLLTGSVGPSVASAVLRVPGVADVPVTVEGGRFLVGFDRDAGSIAELVARDAAGRETVQRLAVARRAWRIERIDAPYRAGRTSAEFEALRPGELARIAAARAVATSASGWRGPIRWPATGRLSGLFGAQRVYQGKPGSFHSGIDIALPTGAPVTAPADGVVVLAADRPFTLEGNLLLVDHGGGLSSAFLHLSRIDVRVGERVTAGQPIGAVGATGRATGPHLHWGLRWREARLDPLLVAGPMS
jgi:murein DD-endopeptidase MepM/ murein hydrolase activator NlpD